ncbi:ubiquitin 3 binding protein But2 C-terminal domain-containing protein [Paraphoma chrysanthemicola]|uniref:Ubiquitin 3 binding protein But2 C-terminal domain-containing protein n=1 Tax=Paraphoma chrysanthemicola TaxID=798071 RepID=A0A8K0VZP7_9PLEO|nr:ubiquitin 3 binding protein But2 C-terminal domain-containing protein [Paraphoma chrysanthemicola]
MRLLLLPLVFITTALGTLQHVEFPHLLLPLSRSNPNYAPGTKLTGEISNNVHLAVSFDVPADVPAAICRLNFHVNVNPYKNAPRELSGTVPYTFIISRLTPGLNPLTTTWSNRPQIVAKVASVTLDHSGSVSIPDNEGWFDCPKGNVAQFLLHPVGARAFRYSWFELDYGWEEGGPHGVVLEMHT